MFTESNTVEAMIRDLLCGTQPARPKGAAELPVAYLAAGLAPRGAGWHYAPAAALPRQPQDVFVESFVRDALIRLNPDIAAQPERADEALYKLRAIVLGVRSDGLVRANEEFTAWLRGERSMPFGPNHAHVTVRLVDFDDLSQNHYVATTQYIFRAGPSERRADLILLVNGFPLVRPAVLLDILANFTLFATDKKKRRLKIVCRYQQYTAANRIVQRVLAGAPRQGLIWHFQGSGKSLLMVFAAQKLRMQPSLRNPTVIIAVDRIDLDVQISAAFHAADIPNLVKAETREELAQLLRQDSRKIIITTIFKFGEVEGLLNARENITVLVDEAHRTQEGELGIRMRAALSNAFFFGLTGTPINRRDRNTFATFGAVEDAHGYMSRYSFDESIRDGATLPLRFEPRLVELHIDKEAIDSAYRELTGSLSDLDRETLTRTAARMSVLVKTPERIDHICTDIADHFTAKVAPNGFKGMVVTYDQESCLLYKARLDQHLPPEFSEVVISVSGKEREDARYLAYKRDRDAEERLLDRYRDPNDPLQILVVTAKLLTGFDAPILQAIYLDKPLRDHTLLQAICRANRTYGDQKTCGLIVDYLGVFDDVAKSLTFDEAGFHQVVANIQKLKDELPRAMQRCLACFPDIDRMLTGYEGLLAAQACLPNNDVRDAFAAEYNALATLWETLSPDPLLIDYEADYRVNRTGMKPHALFGRYIAKRGLEFQAPTLLPGLFVNPL
jgi:type I restriction enzyme R subunit